MNTKIFIVLSSVLLLALSGCSLEMASDYTQPVVDIVRDQSNSLIKLFINMDSHTDKMIEYVEE